MSRSKSEQDSMVPVEEGQPIIEAAQRAGALGRRTFVCELTVSYSSGSGIGFGGKKSTTIRSWDPSAVIDAVEASGWLLAHIDHVWEQTEHNASLGKAAQIKGLTRAHMLFRAK